MREVSEENGANGGLFRYQVAELDECFWDRETEGWSSGNDAPRTDNSDTAFGA